MDVFTVCLEQWVSLFICPVSINELAANDTFVIQAAIFLYFLDLKKPEWKHFV